MLTTCGDPEHRDRALRDGASGFLLKSTPIEEISTALRRPDAPLQAVARPERPSFAEQTTPNAKSRQAPLAQPELGWWQRSARFLSDKLDLTL